MDGYALHFRTLELESILKRRDYKVHLLHGQIVGERAMAGKINVLGGVHDRDFMHVHNFRKEVSRGAEGVFDLGIVHLRLHGSVARGEASAASDVDLIADFDATKPLSVLDMVGLENRLADLLGVAVDLSPAKMLREPVRGKAAREAVLAF